MAIIVEFTELIEDKSVLQDARFALILYLVCIGFLTTQFFWHMVIREVFWITFGVLFVLTQNTDDIELASFIMTTVSLTVAFEVIFFTHMKAQVKLFISGKKDKCQQK